MTANNPTVSRSNLWKKTIGSKTLRKIGLNNFNKFGGSFGQGKSSLKQIHILVGFYGKNILGVNKTHVVNHCNHFRMYLPEM